MITVQNITKRYGTFEAVKDVSFTVGQDQVLGFLGPNGAGKTTVMKILTGYHFPTKGEALVDGVSVQDNPVEVKKRIGYLPESVPVYGDLTVDEYLSFIADARLIARTGRRNAIEAAIASCGLEQVASKKIETLSKGYKQRVGLAQAIIHDPAILILDEPTSGLDPNQIIEIRALIKRLGERKTVILSTHILQEVEAVCSQVLIISDGRIAAQGTPEEIAGNLKGADTWRLTLKGADVDGVKEKLSRLAPAERLGGVALDAAGGGGASSDIVTVTFSTPADGTGRCVDGERIFDWAVAEQLKILGMSQKKISLEDIFVRLTSETRTVNAAAGADRDERVIEEEVE
ncbi:MAG: ATP-binding cassette domain-containing protein [Treponema sp.]|jgi:ABC-2 type transport system ATP-binding protein|nr:ATP-binding cassette domain-containing protein [Treponema sp.]